MCGIVGAVSNRNVRDILIDGLKRLEYRGYDSAGVALTDANCEIHRVRALGKVQVLQEELAKKPISGTTGVAHTRWATHGIPDEKNAHPHMSNLEIALVHNGIIENHEELKVKLEKLGYHFSSDTDTEIIVHLIHHYCQSIENVAGAARAAVAELKGAYSLGIIFAKEPHRLLTFREGSPLVIGVGENEYFIASDPMAIQQVADQFVYLEEGDFADISKLGFTIHDVHGNQVERKVHANNFENDVTSKGKYAHFMLKEIYEQPAAVSHTMEGALSDESVLDQAFGVEAAELFDKVERVQIVACGTSYHAGLTAMYMIEELAGISCRVEVASEFRYRNKVVEPNTLFITISQSGETADTLAALRQAKKLGYLSTLAICNVASSSLVRESALVFLTRAGVEIGVASTKAFTTQLTGLLLLTTALARRNGLSSEAEKDIVAALRNLPRRIEKALALDERIKALSSNYADKHHALFLGRGVFYPIALEGALKLKEISYIHAEAYPAGELKHGPLALVDKTMPIVAAAQSDELLDKIKSNLEEVKARGGELYIFTDHDAGFEEADKFIQMQPVERAIAPIVFTIPLQLLSYHVAVIKGTDVDQPRNLAKSVTVE